MKNDLVGGTSVSSRQISAMVARYRASGESLELFARKSGIPHGRLHYWIYGRKQSQAGRTRSAAAQPLFQEVKLEAAEPQSSRWAAEVGLPSGITVRFGAWVTPAWLREVVQELRRAC
jgi:hypothetical protein